MFDEQPFLQSLGVKGR
jgi:Cytochrome P460